MAVMVENSSRAVKYYVEEIPNELNQFAFHAIFREMHIKILGHSSSLTTTGMKSFTCCSGQLLPA